MPVPRPSALVAVAALVVGAATGVAAPTDVPVWIANSAAAVPIEMPLRLGIPFPKGLLGPEAVLEVRAGDDRLPVQTAPIERWPDGSVRWMLADFVLPSVPGGRSTVAVGGSTGARAAAPRIDATPGPPVRIRSTHLAIEVAPTGGMTIRLLGTSAPDVVVPPIAVDTGQAGPASTTAVRIASAGPERAEVIVEQTHPGGVTTDTHLVAWAGSTTVLLRHRIVNRSMAPSAPLRSIPVSIGLPGLAHASVMVDGTAHEVDVGATAVGIGQLEPTRATIGEAKAGEHLDGGIAVSTPIVTLTAVVPDFWQQYPKAFSVSKDALVVDLVAGGAEPVALGVGAAKTHDVWLRLERASGGSDLPTLTRVFEDPPRALAAPAWTRSTGALPEVIDATEPAGRAFLTHLRSDALRYESRGRHERWDEGPPGPCSARTSAHPHTGFFGVLNWGDWNFPGYRDETKECDGWGNLEYDLPLVFGLAWASTGDPLWATWFERALSHYRDVDVIHAMPAHPDWVGLNHPHKVGHFDARARAKIDLGHVWLGGLLLHSRLTGDERSREAMRAMAERLAALVGRTRTPRQYGWPIIALAPAADATGEPVLRDAALRYGRLAMARFPPDHTKSDWKIGILASGLASLHRLTADAGAREWLTRYGAGLLADDGLDHLDPRYVAVSGYLAVLTGDARYAALARKVASEMEIGTWGKPLAIHGRVGFELLAFAPGAAVGGPEVIPAPDAPPAASDRARR